MIFFLLLGITTPCPESSCPVKYWCRGLFCWEECERVIRGVLWTKSLCWPWTSLIDVKCDHETHQGLLYFWFYWPPCQAVCSLWLKKLHCSSICRHRYTAGQQCNDMLGISNWIICPICRDNNIESDSNMTVIFYLLNHVSRLNLTTFWMQITNPDIFILRACGSMQATIHPEPLPTISLQYRNITLLWLPNIPYCIQQLYLLQNFYCKGNS